MSAFKDREDAFVEEFKKSTGRPMTYETEVILRFGFRKGAEEFYEIGRYDGVTAQQGRVASALGVPLINGRGP